MQTSSILAAEKPQSPNEIIESAPDDHWRKPKPENLLYIELETGRIIIELAPQFAPGHVTNIKLLAKEGFYNNASFYRVINGFVAQGGVGKNKRIPNKGKIAIVAELNKSIDDQFKYMEISGPDGYAEYTGFKSGFPINLSSDKDQVWITHCTGIFAMARGNDVDSGGTEFYITLNNQRHLDNNATVFGNVLYGMHLAQRLQRSTSLAGPIDITGKNGKKLKQVWKDGPKSFLGLLINGFPNLFTVTGPGSPSVLTNMMVAIEQHVEWISDCINFLSKSNLKEVEADELFQIEWMDHIEEVAKNTLRYTCNSWYVGANVPGKKRVFMPYAGGFGKYREKCDEIAENNYSILRIS